MLLEKEFNKKVKVRKIGNSLGIILPQESGVQEGEQLSYHQQGFTIKLDLSEAAREHDRKLIEEGFKDFEEGRFYTEEEMAERYGRYGWGQDG